MLRLYRRFTKMTTRDYVPRLERDVHNRIDERMSPLVERLMAWGIHPDASAAADWLQKNNIKTLDELERYKPAKPKADWRRRLWLWLLSLEGSYAHDPHHKEFEELREKR